jgi:anaerobic selenocysteine-containing dehydrogenase
MNRRDFFKIVATGGAAAAAGGCQQATETILPLVVPNEQLVPGVAAYFATVCRECPAGCGVLARNREGRVVMTMLDSAMAASIRRTLEPGEWIASVNIATDFLVAAKGGRLVARGWVERRGRTLAFARGELRDGAGALVARGQGIWAVRAGRS